MTKLFHFLLSSLILLIIGCSTQKVVDELSPNSVQYQCDKLVPMVMMIGDGMGPEQIKAASYYASGKENSFMVFDTKKFPIHHKIKTDTIDHNLTDSAAGGTRIATRVRTHEGKLGVDKDNRILTNILEEYQRCGFPTGVISTSYLLDATPASFFSHVTGRGQAEEILASLEKTRPNFALGGGKKVSEAQKAMLLEKGFSVVNNLKELNEADLSKPVVGLFTNGTLSFEDKKKENEPALKDLVQFAQKYFDNKKGPFFLMIEGGRIDHAGHDNHLQSNIIETIAFMNEVKNVSGWKRLKGIKHQLIVTADHETGGLQVDKSNGKGKLPEASFSTHFHSQADVDYWSNADAPYTPNIDIWQ